MRNWSVFSGKLSTVWAMKSSSISCLIAEFVASNCHGFLHPSLAVLSLLNFRMTKFQFHMECFKAQILGLHHSSLTSTTSIDFLLPQHQTSASDYVIYDSHIAPIAASNKHEEWITFSDDSTLGASATDEQFLTL